MIDTSYDLVVVGSSFASTFFLKKYLAKAPLTARVLVLERGHLFPHAERLKEKRGEHTAFAGVNTPNTDTYINNTPDKEWVFQSGFGGSSNCWTGCTPRFMPADFRMKTLYGIANDWPLQYDDLDDYYTEVEDAMSISGSDYTPFPRKKPYPQPPHLFTTVDQILHNKYGNLYFHQPTARARIAVNGRGSCCASSTCAVCPVNAKFTIENSNLNVYEDARVDLQMGSQVWGLELTNSNVSKIYFIKDRKEQQVSGEVFALGANAIFNAHILLNSGDTNPFTGKGLGEQIGLEARVFLDNLECVGGSTWVNAMGYMLYDGDHRKDAAACLMEASNYPYVRLEKGKWRNTARFRMIFEDLPQNQNYVSTSADRLKPQVQFSGQSKYVDKGIDRMKQKLPAILSCLPVEKIEYLSTPYNTEAHILGTTRMSQTAKEGVVDKNLIHHQYRNLFVLGGGSFTTYTPANPTLTLSALSLYAADNSF